MTNVAEKFKKDLNDALAEELASKWYKIKEQERMLANQRLEIEKQLIEVVGIKSEGSLTTKIDCFKVRIDQKINHSLDTDAWDEIKDEVPADISPVSYKPQISKTKLQALVTENPSLYRRVCKAITTKPAKPYVTIKITE